MSQLGQGCTLTDKIPFLPTGYITREALASTNFSKCTRALRGGARKVEKYMCFTTEQSNFTIPLLFRRSDLHRSYIIICLKLPYNGVTVDKFPYCAVTSGHHVNVDLPNKSGSIH